RTGRSANMLSRLSIERNSAGLNLIELQQGHSRRNQSSRGNQFGLCRLAARILVTLQYPQTLRVKQHVLLQDSSWSPAMRAVDEYSPSPAPRRNPRLRNIS